MFVPNKSFGECATKCSTLSPFSYLVILLLVLPSKFIRRNFQSLKFRDIVLFLNFEGNPVSILFTYIFIRGLSFTF